MSISVTGELQLFAQEIQRFLSSNTLRILLKRFALCNEPVSIRQNI